MSASIKDQNNNNEDEEDPEDSDNDGGLDINMVFVCGLIFDIEKISK